MILLHTLTTWGTKSSQLLRKGRVTARAPVTQKSDPMVQTGFWQWWGVSDEVWITTDSDPVSNPYECCALWTFLLHVHREATAPTAPPRMFLKALSIMIIECKITGRVSFLTHLKQLLIVGLICAH